MHSLGIVQDQIFFRWALIRQQDKQLIIEKLERSASPPIDVLSIKDLTIVTGLEAETVLRRDVTLPLTSPRMLNRALPFQLESLLPFSLEQALVFPQYHPQKKETCVTLWATTKEHVQSHIERWQSLGIDPDQVSIETLALVRWVHFFFPHPSQFSVIYDHLAVAGDKDRVIFAMSSPDTTRLKLYLKQKYPLFQSIEQVTPQQGWTAEELWQYAPAIGLALEAFEKHRCQLRSPSFASDRQKRREHHLLKTALAVGLSILLLTAGVTAIIFRFQEHELKHKIEHYYPITDESLEENVSHFRHKLLQEAKAIPPIPQVPTTQQVLAWISSLKTSIDISHIEYALTSYPKEKGKNTPYDVQVTLEFQSPSAAEADEFVKLLKQSPSFVEPNYELKWISYPQGYKLSFPLQKSF